MKSDKQNQEKVTQIATQSVITFNIRVSFSNFTERMGLTHEQILDIRRPQVPALPIRLQIDLSALFQIEVQDSAY